MDLSKAERNANGTMIIERITTKRKLEISYNYLSQADCSALLQSIGSTTFNVEYPDPQTGALRTGNFYSGDKTSSAIDYKGGVMRYKDIKFNLIEV
jgi:hypothetical protein